jgi:hypothetical protein
MDADKENRIQYVQRVLVVKGTVLC